MNARAQYFMSTTTGALLRRAGGRDEALVRGKWQPTETIMQAMIGEDSNVEPLTEEQARVFLERGE